MYVYSCVEYDLCIHVWSIEYMHSCVDYIHVCSTMCVFMYGVYACMCIHVWSMICVFMYGVYSCMKYDVCIHVWSMMCVFMCGVCHPVCLSVREYPCMYCIDVH